GRRSARVERADVARRPVAGRPARADGSRPGGRMTTTTMAASTPLTLRPRPVANSLAALLSRVTEREPFASDDGKSAVPMERVVIGGERYVVKYLHVDDDWISRAFGDVGCKPIMVWRSGLLDAMPACIDAAVVGAAVGLGRN